MLSFTPSTTRHDTLNLAGNPRAWSSFLYSSRTVIGAVLLGMLTAAPLPADTGQRGKVTGAVAHTPPDWFKQSFLEIADDVDEAAQANRHVILFFQLDGCPYCDRMLTESFESQPLSDYIRQHFDVIAINVKGDREVVFDENTSLSEKELSELLKVRATPAILFLDHNNNTVVRVNGYHSPQRFRQALEYVQKQAYLNTTLAEYLEHNLANNVYTLRANKLFSNITDLSRVTGPLAVILEDSSCYDCAEFHDNLLVRADVQTELKRFTVVRLDTDSPASIIDVDGNKTTAGDFANKHEMIYRPGVLLFDNGKLLRRYDSLLFSHHFKEGLRYIGGGFYKTQSYGDYSDQRTEELLSQGVDIDLGK